MRKERDWEVNSAVTVEGGSEIGGKRERAVPKFSPFFDSKREILGKKREKWEKFGKTGKGWEGNGE